MVTRGRGFLRGAALRIIQQQPGLTAQEIVRRALQSNMANSSAQNPEGSLVATLHKHHRDINVTRRREGGVYRFYPKGHGSGINTPPDDDGVVVPVRLPRSNIDILDALVAAGKFASRSEAATWAVSKAIASLPGGLKVALDQLRRAASSI